MNTTLLRNVSFIGIAVFSLICQVAWAVPEGEPRCYYRPGITPKSSTLPYDPYPYVNTHYLCGRPQDYPWNGGAGENFESLVTSQGQTLECSSNMSAQSHFNVLAGCLKGKIIYSPANKMGWIDSTGSFRALATPSSAGSYAKYTDSVTEARFYVTGYNSGVDPYARQVGLFTRYKTSNDFYYASIRMDGTFVIKRNRGCASCYTMLAIGTIKDAGGSAVAMDVGTWYRLKLEANGKTLTFSVGVSSTGSYVPQATITDDYFTAGASGILTDGVTAYVDDWFVQ